METRVHYLVGKPDQWHINVPTYGRIEYRHFYPNIDLVYSDNGGQLGYAFVSRTRAVPAQIRLRFEGIDRLRLEINGGLVIEGQAEQWRTDVQAYQLKGATRQRIKAHFFPSGSDEIAVELGDYDSANALQIQSTLAYLGGSGQSSATAIAVDSAGECIHYGVDGATGFSRSARFETGGARTA